MYKTISDFIEEWSFESESTLKLLSILTDESLNEKVYDSGRTLGRLAWHITLTLGEMPVKAGLTFKAIDENAPVPEKASLIYDLYKINSDNFIEALKESWNDNSLSENVNMYDQMWTKSQILNSLVHHQIHHRGQMTVLMRPAGLKVPGIYGPSKEEWSAMNFQPME